MFGSNEIAVKKRTLVAGDTAYQLDFIVPGGQATIAALGAQEPLKILAKPSDHIEAYFEDTS